MSYTFTVDWFAEHEPTWLGRLAEYIGKPGVRYVEVGSYEGRSACWMADNVLTGPGCRIVCIDPWEANGEQAGVDMHAVEMRFVSNVGRLNCNVNSYRAAASQFGAEHFSDSDIVYIDGSHAARDVLRDAVTCWEWVKPGGIMILDDYNWRREGPDAEWNHPGTAVDAFIACYTGEFASPPEEQGGQVWLRRKA